jgi:hypothetical protein
MSTDKVQHPNLNLVWGSLFTLPLILVGVSVTMTEGVSFSEWLVPAGGIRTGSMTPILLGAMFVEGGFAISGALGLILKPPAEPSMEQKRSYLFTYMMVQGALLEAVSVFGFVDVATGGPGATLLLGVLISYAGLLKVRLIDFSTVQEKLR